MSNDLRSIGPEYKAILQNRHLIEVNQDPWGKMGQLVAEDKHSQVWVKPLKPTTGLSDTWVVLYFNNATLGIAKNVMLIVSNCLSNLIDLFFTVKPQVVPDHSQHQQHDRVQCARFV